MQNTKLSGQPIICQLLSFIPHSLVDKAVQEHKTDHYYKTMTTWKQLVFMLYGVVGRMHSLNSLCKCLLFLESKLSYLGISSVPASSTLSDANRRRKSDVFGYLYYLLLDHYMSDISDSYLHLPINGEVNPNNVEVFDSTTISLFVDVFKGAGRNPFNGKKKGGLKVHAVLPLDSMVPEIIWMTEASKNDKDFLGQLKADPGTIYVFDKGYVNYSIYREWTDMGVWYVTRLNENANYEIVEQIRHDVHEYLSGGTILDQVILLKTKGEPLKARLITYKDPLTGKILKFLSNLFDYQNQTIIMLYKNRWEIEPFFKKLKQNFELRWFFSDSQEGIKTQVWIALIANLIFSVIHKRVREAEQFTTLVAMARSNMISYVCLVSLINAKEIRTDDRDLVKIQLDIFSLEQGGVLQKKEKSP